MPTHLFVSHSCELYQENKESENKGAVACEFDLHSDQFAWVNERYQGISIDGTDNMAREENSMLTNRRTEAYCREISSFKNNLQNGRSCSNSW
jgi:hypothetical protein